MPKIKNFGLTSNCHYDFQADRLVSTLREVGIVFDKIDFPIAGNERDGIIFAKSSKKGKIL